jgi:predicted GIY-YIG superfamily endonuclease
MNKPTHKTTLYRAFNSQDELLYVGISYDFLSRLKEHRHTSKWHKLAVKVTLEHFDTRQEAEQSELQAIQNEKPLFNKKDNEDWHNSSTHLLKIMSYEDLHHKRVVESQTKIVEALSKFDHGSTDIALHCYAFQSAIQLLCDTGDEVPEILCVSCEKLYYHELMEQKAFEFVTIDGSGYRSGKWGRDDIWEATVRAVI